MLIADNQLEDACPPKDSPPPKAGSQLKLPNLLDWGLDQKPSSANLDALCPDAEYNIPLCCSGSFDGSTAGLCVACMFVFVSYFHCSLGQSEVKSHNKDADRSIIHNADDPLHWACQLSSWQFCCVIYLAFVSLLISNMITCNGATNLTDIFPVQGRTRLSTILGFINWFR